MIPKPALLAGCLGLLGLLALMPVMTGATALPFIVSSLNPGYSAETLRNDRSLAGIWTEEYLGEIRITAQPDGSFHVHPNGGGLLSLAGLAFKARLFQLRRALFVDLVPLGESFHSIYPAGSHCFAAVKIQSGKLALTLLDPAFVAAQIRTYPRKLQYVEYRNGLMLAEPTAVIQKVLMEIAVKPGSAYDTYVFTRH